MGMQPDAADGAGSLAPGPVAPRLRWALPDALLVWLAGFVASIVGLVIALAMTGTALEDVADDPTVSGIAAMVQFAGMFGALWLVSRAKGRGSLAADFGLRLERRDWPYLPAGVGLFVGLAILALPLAGLSDDEQTIVEQMREASGVALLLLAFAAVVAAPVVEELLFRGLLLRALVRRTRPATAVAWNGALFGAVHLTDAGALRSLPVFVGLGVVSSVVALRTGRTGPSILLHAGFNAVTTAYLVAA
jgi:membrane protease YdiL (CAAX protease family)